MMHSPMQASRPQPAMDEKPENFPALSQERCADRHPFEGHVSAPHKEMTMLQTKAFDYQQQIPAIVKAMVGAETAIGDHGLDHKQIGRGHASTPSTNPPHVCRLL